MINWRLFIRKLFSGFHLFFRTFATESNPSLASPCSTFFAAARTKLRKMKADDAAKKVSASADASKPQERSPHAKEVRMKKKGRNSRPLVFIFFLLFT